MREFVESVRTLGFWRTLYLRYLYRHLMRFAHRHNWHHTRKIGPFEDGSTQLWCEWCGLRYSTPPIDYAKLIRPAFPESLACSRPPQSGNEAAS